MKRVWIAEQDQKAFLKKEEERAKQLAKERLKMEEALASGKKIEEIQLEFMYKPPPGLEEFEEALKRKEMEAKSKTAPVEGSYAKSHEIQHKQFGVQNVFCVRCRLKGHIAGDRECEFSNLNMDATKDSIDPMAKKLMLGDSYTNEFLDESNLRLKERLRAEKNKTSVYDDDPEQKYLDSLSKKDKKMLLKYLLKKERKKRKREEAQM